MTAQATETRTVQPKAPSRSTAKMVLQFGLISVPVQVYNGIEEDANKFPRKMRTGNGAPVNNVTVNGETGEVIGRGDIYKVYVTEDGTEVPLTDEEMHSVLTTENGQCELVGFYDAALIDTYVTKQVHQVRPQTMKSGSKVTRPYDKAFNLLMTTMRAKGTFALLRYVLRGNMHVAGLLPTGDLLEFYWPNEIRQSLPMPEVEVQEAEVELASVLMETMTYDSVPALENTSAAALDAYITEKAEAIADNKPFSAEDAHEANVSVTDDLLAKLQETMDVIKAQKKDGV